MFQLRMIASWGVAAVEELASHCRMMLFKQLVVIESHKRSPTDGVMTLHNIEHCLLSIMWLHYSWAADFFIELCARTNSNCWHRWNLCWRCCWNNAIVGSPVFPLMRYLLTLLIGCKDKTAWKSPEEILHIHFISNL